MMLRFILGCAGGLLIYLSAATGAVAAIYKCVDGEGNTAYQVEPCNDQHQSTEVEIEKFERPTPAPVADQEPTIEGGPRVLGTGKEAEERQKQKTIEACRKLEKRYGAELGRAKKADAARRKAQEEYAKKSRQRDRRILNVYNKDKKRYRKELRRSREADQAYQRSLRVSYQVDQVKSRYQSDKRRLRCDSVFLY